MKKHLLALAALATLSATAAAQTATVYGIFDLSVSKVTNTNATGGSTTALTDATWMPSIFGITGSEDLGGGLKANFNLESDVNMDGGNLTSASGSKLFGRKANVGLTGSFGSLSAGKDIDIIFLQGFIDNVRNSHSSSGFVAHVLATGGSVLDTESVFAQNIVKYSTPTWNGLKATVQHKFGEASGNTSTNKSDAYLVNYAPVAGLNLAGGLKVLRDADNAKSELTYVGATYQIGNLRLAATQHKTDYKTASTATIRTTEFGAAYAFTPALTAAVNYVETKQNSDKGDIQSASVKYALSKRTSVWALASKRNYDGFSIGAANYGQAAYAGKDSTSTSVGVTHSF